MISRIKKKYTKDQILALLDPIIKEWFESHFDDLTPPQAYAIPLISQGKNVLVASPTGSGKTLTAFLMILNQLFKLGTEDKLEDKIYCVYISPLKALANDIERNLNTPLNQICALANEHGIELPKIRVGVRTGDTSTSDRQKMLRKPPHILITTPESLALVISAKRFRLRLLDAQFVIVDEIHEVCSSKRGVHLSLSLERLQNQILTEGLGREFVRIGLSATQAPINEIAKFLVGYNNEHKLREINIIETPAGKELDLRVVCPVQDMNLIPFEIVNAKMYNILMDLINTHRTTLIFTNTRSGTETVVYKLQEQGMEQIAAHHGSLSKETRLDVENRLKNGALAATICSTSLELGIDIGYIDLVCQIGSPKSIAKGLQRIGRAGHALHEVSKGRIIVFDRDDLVECAVLVKNAYEGNIDRINILKNSLDVLAQGLVGMSLEKRWEVDDALALVKQSYCFHKLPKKEFISVLKYIGGKHSVEDRGVYGKVRYHEDTQTFGIRRGARSIYNLNIGTIPQEANYRVIILDSGHPVGVLSEKFVERLVARDVFVLGGKSYEFVKARGMKIYVRNAHGKKPTVPSWTGEMLPRSFDLSREVGKFRAKVVRQLEKYSPDKVELWLQDEYYLNPGSAKSIVNYFIEQLGIIKELPTASNVLIEGYIDGRGYKNIIFHYCFGRRVNDALARAYAYALSKKLKCTVRISLTDDNFMLTLPKRVRLLEIPNLVTDKTLHEHLRGAVRNTELFKQRFRHCAVRSFMILRNYKGREISIRKQLKRSQFMLDFLHELENFPVVTESYNEIMHDTLDIDHAEEVLKKIGTGKISVSYSDYSTIPSPFAHNAVLIGVSDIILMEDRSALLRELHQQVLGRVFSDLVILKPKFELDVVKNYFWNKYPEVTDKASLYSILKAVGPLRLFKEKGKNIYNFTNQPRDRVQVWARELAAERKIISIVRNNELFWVPKVHLKYYSKVYENNIPLAAEERLVLDWLSAVGDADLNAFAKEAKVTSTAPLDDLTGKQTSTHGQGQSNENQTTIGAAVDEDYLPNLGQKELVRILKQLEKRLLVHRLIGEDDESITWFVDTETTEMGGIPKSGQAAETIDFESAADFLIMQYLDYFAPAPAAEIAYDLNLDDTLVTRLLSELEEAGQVTAGNYILGKEVPQYILTRDFALLEQEATQQLPVVDGKDVHEFLFAKNFERGPDLDAYFKKFGIAFGVREVFLRTKEFTLDAWEECLASRRVVQGRFLNGRVCYVPMSDVPLYVSAYRKAPLNDLELTVLNLIKRHRGITRKELGEKLDAGKRDIKDIIDKLERNLYIIREPAYDEIKSASEAREGEVDIEKGATAVGRNVNRYMYYEFPKHTPTSELEIIRRLLAAQGPLSILELKNYTGFAGQVIDKCLKMLVESGEIIKFVAFGNAISEMFITKDDYNIMVDGMSASEPERKVKILSLFDSYSTRLTPELRIKFGDGWQSLIIHSGYLIGIIDLWRLASCIELREITLDDELIAQAFNRDRGRTQDSSMAQLKCNLLKELLEELDNLMGYYRLHGLDIIRICSVMGHDIDSLPNELANVLHEAGYHRIQKFFVKGRIDTRVFTKKQIMKLILRSQHILPKDRFTNPLDAIRTLGGIRSNNEMQLRLDGEFYEIKEFYKNLNLVAGPMIPDYYTYCTEKDLQIYKSAKGRVLDLNMEYVLENIPDNFSISSKNLFDRLTLTKEQFNTARRRLYEGLFLIRDYMNKYKTVPNHSLLTKQYARKYIINRIINNFGIISAEGLGVFTKGEFKIREIRKILRELEGDGKLVKGYFIDDDETLYWVSTDRIDSIARDRSRFNKRFVVSPNDQLAAYLAPYMRKRFGKGSCYIIFKGLEITGMFRIKLKNKKARVIEFQGDDDDWKTMEEFFREKRIELYDEEAEELYGEIEL
ncbi:ATP-dependent helicase [[Eubacterium] cellulosolvens]